MPLNAYHQMIKDQTDALHVEFLERGRAGLMAQADLCFIELGRFVAPDAKAWNNMKMFQPIIDTKQEFKVELMDAVATRGIKVFREIVQTAHQSLAMISQLK